MEGSGTDVGAAYHAVLPEILRFTGCWGSVNCAVNANGRESIAIKGATQDNTEHALGVSEGIAALQIVW